MNYYMSCDGGGAGDAGSGLGDFGSNPADSMSLGQMMGQESAEVTLGEMNAVAEAQATGQAFGATPSASPEGVVGAVGGEGLAKRLKENAEMGEGEKKEEKRVESSTKIKKKRRPTVLTQEEDYLLAPQYGVRKTLLGE